MPTYISLEIVQHEIVEGAKDVGEWGDKLMCTHGIRVSGFRLRLTAEGVSGIQLTCADGTRTYKSEGDEGEWNEFK